MSSTPPSPDRDLLRRKLSALRLDAVHSAAFEEPRPLITVTIVAGLDVDLLMDRAIASVRTQTYDRWEVAVFGDASAAHTAGHIARLGDRRVRFVEVPIDASWPRVGESVHGSWMAPLGHDGEFLPHHLEVLITLALECRAELAYGTLEHIGPTGTARLLTAALTEPSLVTAQQALYLSELHTLGSPQGQPLHWQLSDLDGVALFERLGNAGVRMAVSDAIVSRSYAPVSAQDPEVAFRFRPVPKAMRAVDVPLAAAVVSGTAQVRVEGDALEIETPPEPWSYAVLIPLMDLGMVPRAVRVTLIVAVGRVRVALLKSMTEISVDRFVRASDGQQVVDLPLTSPDAVWRLLVANHDEPGPSRCTLTRIECLVEGSGDQSASE